MLRPCLFVVSLVSGAAPLAAQTWPSPVFEAPVVVLGTNHYAMIELLDHAGTGQQRALAVRQAGATTVQFLQIVLHDFLSGVGTQVFANYVPIVGAMEPFSDVGQIGAPDLAQEAVLGVGDRLFVVRNFAVAQQWTTNGAVTGVAIGDFDGDLDGDVAVVTEPSPGSYELTVHLWNGTALALAATTALPLDSGSMLLAAETDGDNRDDLVVVGDRVQCHGYAAGATTMLHDRSVGMEHPMPVAGDIDGDLDVDLVVFGMTEYVVLRRTGTAAFAVEAPVVGGPATHLHDVDGDGDLDGACCSSGGSVPAALWDPMTFRVSINDGGVFLPAYELSGIGGYHLAGIADLDGNGFQDLVSGRAIHFAQRSLGDVQEPPGPGAHANAHTVGDLDGDGDLDCAEAAAVQWRNAGDGTFAIGGVTLLFPLPPGHAIGDPVIRGDFDGDGDGDLIVEVTDLGAPVGTRLLLQRGGAYADGGEPFPAGTTLSPWLGDDARAALPCDLDGDGDVDLAIGSTGPALFTMLWHNDGSGHFEATPLVGYVAKACADFTNDGRPDLIVADGSLRLLRGQAGGTFGGPEILTLQSWPYFNLPGTVDALRDDVAFGDWNGDGRLDLIAGERSPTGGCFPAVLLGQGGATPPFVATNSPIVGVNGGLPTRFLAADVDGDGRLDCVFGNPPQAHIDGCAVAFGTGSTPPFDPWQTQALMVPVTALADLDGDGDPDMVGARIAKNHRASDPDAGRCRQWGEGSPGVGGVAPLLGVRGRVAAGHALTLRLSGAEGATCGLLALGDTTWNVPLFGGTSYVVPTATVVWCANGVAGAAGDGRAELVLPPLPPGIAGQQFELQAAMLDSASALTLSNALTLGIGQ